MLLLSHRERIGCGGHSVRQEYFTYVMLNLEDLIRWHILRLRKQEQQRN